jgi:hypothetical protein
MISPEHQQWLRRRAKAQQAIGIVMDRLAQLNPSVEVGRLRSRAEHVLEAACSWHQGSPEPEQQHWLLGRVVSLDAAIRALERTEVATRAHVTGP